MTVCPAGHVAVPDEACLLAWRGDETDTQNTPLDQIKNQTTQDLNAISLIPSFIFNENLYSCIQSVFSKYRYATVQRKLKSWYSAKRWPLCNVCGFLFLRHSAKSFVWLKAVWAHTKAAYEFKVFQPKNDQVRFTSDMSMYTSGPILEWTGEGSVDCNDDSSV